VLTALTGNFHIREEFSGAQNTGDLPVQFPRNAGKSGELVVGPSLCCSLSGPFRPDEKVHYPIIGTLLAAIEEGPMTNYHSFPPLAGTTLSIHELETVPLFKPSFLDYSCYIDDVLLGAWIHGSDPDTDSQNFLASANSNEGL
jgi:hypothetical protein